MPQLDLSIYRQPQNLGNIGESFLAGQQAAAQMREREQHQQIQQLQLEEHRQRASQAQQEAVTEQKVRALFAGETPPTPQAIMSAVGPERGAKIIQGLGALQKENQAQYTSQQELLRDVMAGMDALPEGLRAEAYPGIRQNLVDRQLIGAQDVPEAYDSAWFQQARDFGKKQVEPKAPGTREVKVRNADGSETVQIVQDTAGQTFESAPPQVVEKKHAIRVPGPNGRPMMKLFTETELAQGVQAYQDPQSADKGSKLWVLRDGKAVRVSEEEIRAGDEPHAVRSTGDTAQDRQRNARTQAARGFLGKLNELREKINTKMGPAAGVTGMARRGMANVGWDPDVAEYERERSAGGRSLAVAIMGAQNLSDADAKAWSDMLPGATVDKDTAKRLMTQVETMLNDMQGGPSSPALPGAPAGQNFGKRADGTAKGNGFLGALKRPDGQVSSEISIGVNFDGQEREIPTLVPTLTKDEIQFLLKADGKYKMPDSIVKKAVEHARQRIAAGKSPFAGEGEAATAATATSSGASSQRKEIPGHPGRFAVSSDGGKTWKAE